MFIVNDEYIVVVISAVRDLIQNRLGPRHKVRAGGYTGAIRQPIGLIAGIEHAVGDTVIVQKDKRLVRQVVPRIVRKASA